MTDRYRLNIGQYSFAFTHIGPGLTCVKDALGDVIVSREVRMQ